jgi:PAS domain S-box-containing protein
MARNNRRSKLRGTSQQNEERANFSDTSERRRIEERFRQVVEFAPNAMVVTNPSGQIEMVNAEAQRVFGYTRAELLGQKVEILVPERFRPAHPELRAGFLANPQSRPMGAGRDLYALKKDGSEFPVEIGLNPIETDEGPMVLAAIVDISERIAAERDRERQAEELRRSNAELAQFAHVVAHDLRAPLRAMQNLATWIAEDLGASASDETRENLALLRRRGERLERLLAGLMDYALAGRAQSSPEAVDTAVLVTDIAAYLEPPPAFSVTCSGAMPVLQTSKAALEHVLQNLISNALKHHDRDAGEVVISARNIGDKVEFTVRDDGPGIAPAFHDRVFVVFQTLKPRDEVEGGGVGLAIVKKIVEARGGRIWIESEPPRRGAAFIFTWPKGAA